MAQATTISWGKGVFYLGDAGTPTEAFAAVCGLLSAELAVDKDLNSIVIPDCADADAAAWTGTEVSALSWSFKGSGVLAKEAWAEIEEAGLAAISRNIKFRLVGFGSGGATPDRMFSGAGHLKFSIKGERGNRWEVDFDITGDGALTAANVAVAS